MDTETFTVKEDGIYHGGHKTKFIRYNKRGKTAVIHKQEGEDEYKMVIRFADPGELRSFLEMYGIVDH